MVGVDAYQGAAEKEGQGVAGEKDCVPCLKVGRGDADAVSESKGEDGDDEAVEEEVGEDGGAHNGGDEGFGGAKG